MVFSGLTGRQSGGTVGWNLDRQPLNAALELIMVHISKSRQGDTTVFDPPFGVMSPWYPLAVGLISVAAGTLLRYALDHWLKDRGVFATFFPAVAVAVFLGRL